MPRSLKPEPESRASALRVVKLGGSLLDLDGLAVMLRRWLASQAPMTNVIVVGGGRLADAIRDAFARHELSEEAAHWLCVRLLGVTAELLAALLPEAVLVKRYSQLLRQEHRGRLLIFETESFLRDEEPALSPEPLPHGWDVTSDSIAARLAALLAADELVLLKSRLPKDGSTLADAVVAEYVDRHFVRAAAGVTKIRCVNLRESGLPDVRMLWPVS